MEGLTPARSRDRAWLRPWLRACEPEAQGVGWVQPGGRLGSLRLGEGNVSHGGSRSEEGTVCAVGVLKRERASTEEWWGHSTSARCPFTIWSHGLK